MDVVEEPSYTCSQCGGPNPAHAQNCQWCGSSLKSPPLPSYPSPPPLRFEAPPPNSDVDQFESDGSRGIPMWIRGIVVVIVFVVLIGAAVSLTPQSQPSSSQTPVSSGPGYPVNVTVIDLTSSDNACGLNGATEPGFQGVTNAVSGETWHITGSAGGCTVNGLSAVTGGFQVVSLDVPQSIAAGQTANISVSFVMIILGGPYTGPLVIAVT